jgi:hypothetical protein
MPAGWITHTASLTTAAGASSNTSFDGTGSIIEVVPTNNNHVRSVLEIHITSRGITDNNMIRVYKYSAEDSAWIPHSEINVSAVPVVNEQVQRWSVRKLPLNLLIDPADKLGFSAHIIGTSPANEFYVTVEAEIL